MDYRSMPASPAFAQPQPLRPYQYPSRYSEREDPFGSRPLSVPASHILRSNNFSEQHVSPNQGIFDHKINNDAYADFANLSPFENPQSNNFIVPNPSMMAP